MSDTDQILKTCHKSKEVVIIYGEAGVGKTTLLTRIAQTWLEGCLEGLNVFDFVFFMPLRLCGSRTIVDMICRDLGLLSPRCCQSLKDVLSLHSQRVLFLLDSYEELAFDVEELNKLVSRELYADKTVLVTSRPGSKISRVLPMPHVTVQLRELSEKDIIKYVRQYCSTDDEEVYVCIREKFGIQFLQRPINLALVCCLYVSPGLGSLDSRLISQTELLNRIMAHIVQAYTRNRYRENSLHTVMTLLSSQDVKLSGAKAVVKEICKLCFDALVARRHWLDTEKSIFTAADLKDFGLFVDGPVQNSVALPHLLLEEYFTAVYLAVDGAARNATLRELHRRICEGSGPDLSLADVVRPLGLENVIRFLVGLSPSAGQQLSSLFVIKQRKTCNGFYQSVYSYELDLLQECTNDGVKSAIAEALLNAPVVSLPGEFDYVTNEGSALLDVLPDDKCKRFLEKAYNCSLNEDVDRRVTLCRCDSERHILCDGFLLGCLSRFGVTCLQMGDKIEVQRSEVSVGHLPLLTLGATEFILMESCTLLTGRNCLRGSSAHLDSKPGLIIDLGRIKGLHLLKDCSIKLPRVSKLWLTNCGDVDICALSLTYTKLSTLRVNGGNRLIYGQAFCPWQTLVNLRLWECPVKLMALTELCPCLVALAIWRCRVSADGANCQWQTLETLKMEASCMVKSGKWLGKEEAGKNLADICPSAIILIRWYNVSSLPIYQ